VLKYLYRFVFLQIFKKKASIFNAMTKKELAITLSKLDVFSSVEIKSEQYPTDSEIAADILWFASLNDDIEGKIIADLGAGTGILGIGCLLMGAKKVFFVEKDKEAVKVLERNLKFVDKNNFKIINSDITYFNKKVDVVVQNPPFGTKDKHADVRFLEKATTLSNIVYSFHKSETKNFIDKKIEELKFKMTHYFEFDFPIKHSMKHHRKKIERIRVGCWRIKKHS